MADAEAVPRDRLDPPPPCGELRFAYAAPAASSSGCGQNVLVVGDEGFLEPFCGRLPVGEMRFGWRRHLGYATRGS